MSDVLVQYDFVSVVRRGAAAGLTTADSFGDLPYRGQTSITARLSSSGPGVAAATDDLPSHPPHPPDPPDPAGLDIQLYGPGDIVGIDHRHVVRTEPADGTPNFEANYLAGIEFDHPDFAWLFTPAADDAAHRLRPWLSLIVLADGEWEPPKKDVLPVPLPRISVTTISALPPLGESWAWAHAQVTGGLSGTGIESLLQHEPERVICRLLCPRQLAAGLRYTAFLVPAFEHGRLAGLGQPTPSGPKATTAPAWSPRTAEPLELPVYYRFSFQTARVGDFASLAQRLVPRELSPKVGIRLMSVDGHPGLGLPSAGPPLGLSGALRAVTTRDSKWHDPDRSAFRQQLADDINLGRGTGDPRIVPPLYGRWHAARMQVHPDVHGWVHELNLDPRTRSIAGFGTRVVLAQRSQLLASAWAQVAGVDRANGILRQAQLARGASRQLFEKHLKNVPAESVLALTQPLHSRLLASPCTVAATLARSRLPASALTPAFRRLTRAHGPLRRRQRASARDYGRLLADLASGALTARVNPRPGGLVTLDDVADRAEAATSRWRLVLPPWLARRRWILALVAAALLAIFLIVGAVVSWPVAAAVLGIILLLLLFLMLLLGWIRRKGQGALRLNDITPAAIAASPPRPGFRVVPGQAGPPPDQPQPGGTDSADAAAFRQAAAKIAAVLQAVPADPDEPPAPDLPALAQTILGKLDPETTIPARIAAVIGIDRELWDPDDPLEPIMAAPEFRQPMYEPLRDLSQDLLLPGLDQVPPDTLGVLEVNLPFIEAYMVGLNHEFARQLLWNEYPTDQRGSYFRQFWDTSGYVRTDDDPQDPAELREKLKDIPPIHKWSHGKSLGEHSNRDDIKPGEHPNPDNAKPGNLALLIRGELLRRYPRADVYACEAVLDADGKRVLGDDEKHPLFRGTLAPDLTFLGFDLDASQARGEDGSEGWFFVFQQQHSEPRFGLEPAPDDPAAAPPNVTDWNELSWANFGNPAFASPAAQPQDIAEAMDAKQWGADSAHVAAITMRRPVRVAVHAETMLPADA